MKKILFAIITVAILSSCQSEYKAYLKLIDESYAKFEACITDEEYNSLDLPGKDGIPSNCSKEEISNILAKQFEFHRLLIAKRYIINNIRYRIEDYGTVISKDDMKDLTRECMAQVSPELKKQNENLAGMASMIPGGNNMSMAGLEYSQIKKAMDENPEVQKLIKDFVAKYSPDYNPEK